ncbi:unnamed protein product [Eretmochelys imbricata]
MGPAAGAAESEELLQELCVNGNGHRETGGNPDPPWNCQKSPTCGVVVALIVVSSPLIAAIIALADSWAFLLRHKGIYDHWISLRREQGQPWKWTNGSEFNHLFQIRGGGDCAYLNNEKGVSSSRCYMERRWICSKPEVYVMGKETALEGGSK